jgi:uncharacterized protein YqfA (UPF0365 family)
MPLSRGIWAGIAATLAWTLLSVYFFFQYMDPMLLVLSAIAALVVWGVALLFHVLRRGVPVRVVGKE